MGWLENVDIRFQCGDLLSTDVEGIVCPVKANLEEYGNISRKLFGLCGPHLKSDLNLVKGELSNRKLELGQAISLDCKDQYAIGRFKKLIFVAIWDFASEYNAGLFYKAYVNSIREAYKFDLRSIGLPLFVYEGKLKLTGQAIVKVILDLDRLKGSEDFSVEELVFVSHNEAHVNALMRDVEPRLY